LINIDKKFGFYPYNTTSPKFTSSDPIDGGGPFLKDGCKSIIMNNEIVLHNKTI